MLPTKFWAEMSWRDFAAADMSKIVAVLPVAAIEQHGPHLPVGVDTFINEGYLATAVKQIPDDMPVLILPIQAVGKSNEHIEYPGTLTFSLETITRAWTEIGDSVARTGCRKLIFMNSHGGNVPVIDVVARELRVRHRMLAVHAAWHRLGYPAELFSAQERAHGIHGGEAETSLMLAFRPKTVRMSEAQNFVSFGLPSRLALAGWRVICTRWARPGMLPRRRPRRAKLALRTGRRCFSICCATCWLSTLRASTMDRWGARRLTGRTPISET
jgi:creatinine amidohydrolase